MLIKHPYSPNFWSLEWRQKLTLIEEYQNVFENCPSIVTYFGALLSWVRTFFVIFIQLLYLVFVFLKLSNSLRWRDIIRSKFQLPSRAEKILGRNVWDWNIPLNFSLRPHLCVHQWGKQGLNLLKIVLRLLRGSQEFHKALLAKKSCLVAWLRMRRRLKMMKIYKRLVKIMLKVRYGTRNKVYNKQGWKCYSAWRRQEDWLNDLRLTTTDVYWQMITDNWWLLKTDDWQLITYN